MNLFKKGICLFYASNMVISFVCTSFLGTTYSGIIGNEENNGSKTIILDTDLEPVSQLGDGNNQDAKSLKEETKKKETNEKTVSKVSKKEVASTVKYAPAKYSEVTGSAIVEYAMRYVGLRYVSGGNSLSSGTDCSGFTKLIYKEFGVTLSRTVAGQMKNGTYVKKADLQKGDLVIYGNGNGKAVHVAMYIGNGKVIHESNHRDGVKISNLNMMQYITARRVINSTSIKIVEDKIEKEKQEEQEIGVVNNTDSTTNTIVQDNVLENNKEDNNDTEKVDNTSSNVNANTEEESNNRNNETTSKDVYTEPNSKEEIDKNENQE